jgi:hypothetical protein
MGMMVITLPCLVTQSMVNWCGVSVCPSADCDKPLFDKRTSAMGFVKYLENVENFAPN